MYHYILFFLIHTSLADYYQLSYQSQPSNNNQYLQGTQYAAPGYVINQDNTQNTQTQVSNGGILVNWNTPVYTAQNNYMYQNSMQYFLRSDIMQNVAAAYSSEQGYSNNDCYKTYSVGRRRRRAIEGLPYFNYCDYYGQNGNTVYPEILVFVDNVIFSHYGYDVQRTVEYVVSFWKQVDMRFRNLRSPGIMLNIAGIILIQDELPFVNGGASPYFQTTYYYNNVLDGFSKFLFNQNEFKINVNYDIAILMTGKNMNSVYSSDVGGMAFTGGACKQVSNMIYSAGIIKDDGNFGGVVSATHELAHTLGASHDGDSSMQGMGLLGAAECPQYGYIMSPISNDRNQFLFSACSQRSISYNLNLETANCLRNYPAANSGISHYQTVMAGK